MENYLRSWSVRSLARTGASGLLALFLTVGTVLVSSQTAQAQFPINESFAAATTSNFTLGGSAKLTGSANTPGYLQLTPNTTNQAGYAILNGSFPSPKGFSISFEFFAYANNTGGADGFSVFMIDANGTDPKAGQFTIGGLGGSLGYAPNSTVGTAGVSKGYIGIGIDEFGNYSNPTEGRTGGPGVTQQAVAIRGPGTGTTGYEYLTGTGTLPFKLSVATTRAQPGSDDYRKAYIYVVPSNGAYNVTVRIQHGTTITTTTDSYKVPTPPTNLRIGFSSSTGGSTNVHEIRNLAIVDNPYAKDDLAGTTFNTAVDIKVLANDQAIGNDIDPATVDLDPTTTGIQSTFTVAGQGTFKVNSQGVVTFTPSGTFAGTVTIPYVVSDALKQVSNVANIVVVVKGADVATGISGPTSAIPGAQVTYTVSSTNIGSEPATNLIPTLQLPSGLTIPASANYTYNSNSGLVTFNQVTLNENASVSNSVTFNVPTSGTTSIDATAGYTYPTGAVVPDPTSGNNTAAITTAINGASTLATDCAVPGKDGVGSLNSNSTPNTYYPGTSVSTANGVSTISVGTAVGGTTAVAVGDLVMVVQMQGATMDVTATNTYGTASSITAGQYEYAAVGSVSGSPVTSITLTKTLANTYASGTNQNFQVIRVPQYSSLTVDGIVTGTAWNSQTKVGGVLALDVAGTTSFTGTTPGLNMTAKGFNGGGGVSYNTSTATTQTVYASTTAAGGHGSKGESIAGTPRSTYNGSAVTTGTSDGYTTGSNNRGAPANGGGGAQDFTTASNSGNSGGGGGGNGGAGGTGGYGFRSNSTGNLAVGGRAFSSSGTKITMGGGGGAGSNNAASNAQLSSGGVGGGIVILRTGSVSGTATLQANGGGAAAPGGAFTDGGGGGGAGGTVLVLATPPTGVADGLTNITANAAGGAGGSVNNIDAGASYGPGGGGGGGVVFANAALSATNVALGANGQTGNGNGNGNGVQQISFGATAGGNGSSSPNTSAASTATMGGASSCLPVLALALSTSTPNVTRAANRTPTPATYIAVISNTGGTAQSTGTTMTLDPLFTYDNTYTPVVTLTTASGTATTLPSSAYSVSGTTSPVISGVNIPSGATLRITFRATIASTAVNSTVYQASAAVAFTDPTRTAAANTASPGGTFNGGGTVAGTNYAAASSTREDVTIVAPLPVELTRFEVAAVRQDAVLAWTTASEKNNDRFVVERSFTGYGFTTIGTVRGQGNSTRTTTYAFTDRGAGRLAAETIYYRLQQVDVDGTASYGPVRTVQFAAAAKATATLYPNPSQDKTTVDLTGLATGTYSVQVLDLAGRVLRTQQSGAQASVLDLQGLPQGAYIVLVRGAGVSQALPLIRN